MVISFNYVSWKCQQYFYYIDLHITDFNLIDQFVQEIEPIEQEDTQDMHSQHGGSDHRSDDDDVTDGNFFQSRLLKIPAIFFPGGAEIEHWKK